MHRVRAGFILSSLTLTLGIAACGGKVTDEDPAGAAGTTGAPGAGSVPGARDPGGGSSNPGSSDWREVIDEICDAAAVECNNLSPNQCREEGAEFVTDALDAGCEPEIDAFLACALRNIASVLCTDQDLAPLCEDQVEDVIFCMERGEPGGSGGSGVGEGGIDENGCRYDYWSGSDGQRCHYQCGVGLPDVTCGPLAGDESITYCECRFEPNGHAGWTVASCYEVPEGAWEYCR